MSKKTTNNLKSNSRELKVANQKWQKKKKKKPHTHVTMNNVIATQWNTTQSSKIIFSKNIK